MKRLFSACFILSITGLAQAFQGPSVVGPFQVDASQAEHEQRQLTFAGKVQNAPLPGTHFGKRLGGVAKPEVVGLTQALIMRARSQVNSMYRFGGTTPETGFDCSGFIGWVFGDVVEKPLPRTADALYAVDAPKIGADALKPGDLLFYRISGKRVSHVTMYIGNRTFIHATRAGQRLRTESMDLPYWRARFAGAKRILASNLVRDDIHDGKHDTDESSGQIFSSNF